MSGDYREKIMDLINESVSESTLTEVGEVIEEIEKQVIDAFDYLNDIDSVRDLSNVENALDILNDLKTDLY